MQNRRKRPRDKASPDLTPMIDVTFQLLIFFILCTRFAETEDFHRADLPRNMGEKSDPSPPKETLTIYCNWDEELHANSYVVAIGARGRVPVDNSFARLDEIVIFSKDNNAAIREKQARYKAMFDSLVATVERYVYDSGAKIEVIEIAFAKDSSAGASSGTAPWMFVSGAIDAAADINSRRAKEDKLTVAFKFVDALGRYSR